MIVAEFFSGIGGYRSALLKLAASGSFPVVEKYHAFDVNDNANAVYHHAYGDSPSSKNISLLTAAELDCLQASLWTHRTNETSPCQPYTRNGPRKHMSDNRSLPLLSLMSALRAMQAPPTMMMLENVLGFELSDSYRDVMDALAARGYVAQGFIANPTTLGIPNSRPRFYLLAKRGAAFVDPSLDGKVTRDPEFIPRKPLSPISAYLEPAADEDAGLEIGRAMLWKQGAAFDFVRAEGMRSCCFTKNYGGFARGTGSVLMRASAEALKEYASALPQVPALEDGVDGEAITVEDAHEDDGGDDDGSGDIKGGYCSRAGDSLTETDNEPSLLPLLRYHTWVRQRGKDAAMQSLAALESTLYGHRKRLSARLKLERDQRRGEWWQDMGPCPLEVLKPRYFSSREICRLLGYPESFTFPDGITEQQRWKLLGNSLSVEIVLLLLEYLIKN
ncbi:C-5 cytosine-specific DNA methylase [Irineochytrium annulatum]|nr:C-5 cytosine-specific DNA methylase [Irineochytrium annulatum]